MHASKEPLVRSMMGTVQQIAFSFNMSAQWLRVFQAELGLEEDAQAGMNSRTNLHSLCEIKLSICGKKMGMAKPDATCCPSNMLTTSSDH